MNVAELKKSAELFSPMLPPKETVDYMSIEDYVLSTLDTEKNSIENSEILFKNFVHLMCHICLDIKEIVERLADYKSRYTEIKDVKSNRAEFKRRKLIYFCDLNKEALREIDDFIASGILPFLLDHNYDTLNTIIQSITDMTPTQ